MGRTFSEFRESDKSLNCNQFRDPVSYMCFAGVVVACWSLTQEMASSSPFAVMTKIFVTTEFSELEMQFSRKKVQ